MFFISKLLGFAAGHNSELFAIAADNAHFTAQHPSAERMDWLIREAHVHTLITFQDTGLKLKLLNSLFAGRHTLVNRMMLAGSGLDSLCHIADTPEELVRACNQLMKMPFDDTAIAQRRALLFPAYSNAHQAQKLWGLIQAQSSAKS